jgi:type II secretory pathway component GspD/PulD (secretin)
MSFHHVIKIDSPTIQQRRIKTTVSVNDGEGIILGA